MRCARCSRPLLSAPAATIRTRSGLIAWGPVCARLSGLVAPRNPKAAGKAGKSRRTRGREREQLDLFGADDAARGEA